MINNRFIIKKKLGEGRSKVFLCTDVDNPDKEYAIKILNEKADTEEIKIFRKEFFTLQNLNHPNIISSYEEGTVVKTDDEEGIMRGSWFIILEYFPGVEILRYTKINEEQVLKIIIKQICSVLYYLHQSNYIYYDLKSENILISESDNKPFIKLIDMGFAHHLRISDGVKRGTKEYIAPEILKNEQHNHQIDLYSLGILLYRIVYGKFPFNSESEIEIYKEHIEREFEFPVNGYSKELIGSIKRLLEKDPVNRYDNSLQILKDIDENISQDIVKHFTPANVFADREKIILQIENFLKENKDKEVIILSGSEGSGKTSLIYKVYSDFDKVILVGSASRRSGINYIQYFLKKIVYSGYVYPFLDRNLIEQVEKIILGNFENLIDDLKSIFTRISTIIKFNLILDDFNLLNEFTRDIFNELIPILQVNGVNIILSERSDHPEVAGEIINKTRKVSLSPFNEDDLISYIDISLTTFFPKDQLKKLVINHSDLLPGNIINFIRDLILLNIIRFTFDGPEIIEDENTEKLLESSQEEIFRLRFLLLLPDEIKIAQILSSFENLPDINVVAALNDLTSRQVYGIIKNLEEKNIIQASSIENTISFTSDSLKKYAYSTIRNKEEYHLQIADFISNSFKDFNRNELARHYEKGKKYISSYEVLLKEIDEADQLSAFSYKKNLLNHLLQLPLPPDYEFELKYKLSLTLNKLNDPKSTLNLVKELLLKTENEEIKNELLILKGSSLIELGEVEEGKNLLNLLVEKIVDENRKQKLLVEIAYAEFDLGNYSTAKKMCFDLIGRINSTYEEKGKCYNLLGLMDYYKDNNLNATLDNFKNALQMYSADGLTLYMTKMEGNLGNTYFLMGDNNNAEKHWRDSLHLNISIGNLDQEARLLLSFGILYYNWINFDKAVEQYKRANNIFSSLGNKNGEGLSLLNLGELHHTKCEYQNAFICYNQARDIFNKSSNIEEEAEVLFMLGKFFITIGDEIQLKQIMKHFKNLVENNHLLERHNNNLLYLELIDSFYGANKVNLDFLHNVSEKFKEQNEGVFFAEGFSILCEVLIQSGIFEIAFNIINDNKLNKFCSENYLYKAEKKYLESLIASRSDRFKLHPAIQLLEEAHDLIKDEQITELTWKVLFSLGENYYNRGNFKKANEYLSYSNEVINFISNGIQDEILKDKYLAKPERKYILEKIELMLNK